MFEISTCSSRLTGRIRGLKVREERILTDRRLAKNVGQMDELLSACREDAGAFDFFFGFISKKSKKHVPADCLPAFTTLEDKFFQGDKSCRKSLLVHRGLPVVFAG